MKIAPCSEEESFIAKSKIIYLDNAATTRVCQAARLAAGKTLDDCFFNTAENFAVKERVLLKQCETDIKRALGVTGGTLVFTSGATESNNLAIFGIITHPSKSLAIGNMEHSSVYAPAMSLKNKGFNVSVGNNYENAALVSMCLVNSDIGQINEMPKTKGLLHIDATQGFCKMPIPKADLISISGHKIGAPKGVGALWIRDGITLQPQILGGNQQTLRSGTINLQAIAGFAAAAKTYTNAGVKELSDYLKANLPNGFYVNGTNTISNIISITTPKVFGETIMNALAQKQIYISTGSACNAKGTPNRTLAAIGHKKPLNVIRVSLSSENTKEEIDIFLKELIQAHDNLS